MADASRSGASTLNLRFLGGSALVKPKAQSVARPGQSSRPDRDDNHAPEPLSGSKKVKNRNHSRHNNAEG
jgi:small acid-soluble spore protein P (minor)